MTKADRHRITIRDDGTCGTCRRPVGWMAFLARGSTVSFVRHYDSVVDAIRGLPYVT